MTMGTMGDRPRPAPPSEEPHPFQPAGFFEPPVLPALPRIKETPSVSAADPPKQGGGLRDFLSVVGVLASALVLAFVLINYVFQSYQVEGPSMQQTLQDRDHLVVWKLDKTFAGLRGKDYIPQRGDIVIFDPPATASGTVPPGEQLIKRVIALPGERVVFSGTQVTVYNTDRPDGFNPDTELPYGKLLRNDQPSSYEVTVPDGQVVVAGDNRDNSRDSREFGPVPSDKIVGRLLVRVLPLNTFKRF